MHNFFVTAALLLLVFTQPTVPQLLECCGRKLLDSLNYVVIETSTALTPGTYNALIVKVCVAEPFHVQIWTRTGNDFYTLKWWTLVYPTQEQTSRQNGVVFSFNRTITVTSDDRLAIFSPENSYLKIPVPYTISTNSELRLSSLSYDTLGVFGSGVSTNIRLQSWSWTRTFTNHLKLCTSASNCPSLNVDQYTPIPISYSNYITISSNCCSTVNLPSCDQTNSTTTDLTDQSVTINSLIVQINNLKQIIERYKSGLIETGYCPDDTFISGTYGLGNCYKLMSNPLQVAQAQIQCSSFRSRLVFIKDLREDNFLKDLIYKQFNKTLHAGVIYQSWSSAIYSKASSNWFWFNNLLPTDNLQPFGAFTNWKGRTVPRNMTDRNICGMYTLNLTSALSYWENGDCTMQLPYICKVAKLCY